MARLRRRAPLVSCSATKSSSTRSRTSLHEWAGARRATRIFVKESTTGELGVVVYGTTAPFRLVEKAEWLTRGSTSLDGAGGEVL